MGPGGAIGGQRTPGPAAPNAWSSVVGIATGIGVPVVAWSLSTALGILVFAAFLLRPVPRRRVRARAGPAGASVAVAPAVPVAHAPTAPTINGRGAGGGAAPAGPHQPVLFGSRPRRGTERRTIAYRLVRLSDGPDDIRSHEIGRLDRGDQVEVIGEHEGFLRVRTPSGQEGWVPRVVIVG